MIPNKEREKLSRMVALYETKEELENLFNNRFMQKYTNYNDFDEFRFAGAVFINWSSDFVVGDRTAFDCCVKGKTSFSNWEQMYQSAIDEVSHQD